MSDRKPNEKILIAIKILGEIIPKLVKFFQSSEWRGRFRKKTDERLDQLETQVQQLTEAVANLTTIINEEYAGRD